MEVAVVLGSIVVLLIAIVCFVVLAKFFRFGSSR